MPQGEQKREWSQWISYLPELPQRKGSHSGTEPSTHWHHHLCPYLLIGTMISITHTKTGKRHLYG